MDPKAPLTVILWIVARIGAPFWMAQNRRAGWLRFLPSLGEKQDDQHTLRACPACAALIPRRASCCPYCQHTLPALAARTR